MNAAVVGYINAIKEITAHADGMVQNVSHRIENSDHLELLDRIHARMLLNITDLRTLATEHDLEGTLALSLNLGRKRAAVVEFPNTAG